MNLVILKKKDNIQTSIKEIFIVNIQNSWLLANYVTWHISFKMK
jgi:hypothetical protein